MGRFVFRRAIQGLIALLILISIVFILSRVTGNPVVLMLPSDATEAQREELTARLGLDRPYYEQYLNFVLDLLRGDLGDSLRFQKPAFELYIERLPASLKLVGVSALMAILVAIPLGVIAGSRRGSFIDSLCRLVAVVGIAAPSFWIGLVLMQIFAVQLGVLPAGRIGGIEHYILPGFSGALFTMAGLARLLRSSMIEALDSEFVKLARIKGASQRAVVWKHSLRNALVPVLSFAGMQVAIMVGGHIVVETIFAWPGVGRLAYEGIMYRDYPLVQTVIVLNGALIVFMNFIVDVLYSYVDPRIRHD